MEELKISIKMINGHIPLPKDNCTSRGLPSRESPLCEIADTEEFSCGTVRCSNNWQQANIHNERLGKLAKIMVSL